MAKILKDRVAVVTGSGQGIGRTIALAIAKEGARLVTNNRWPGTPGGDAETTAKEIIDTGGQAVAFFGDISRFDIAQKLIQTAVDNFGRLDILVNNAGVLERKMVWDMTEEDWDRGLDSSLKGSFNCIRHALSIMIKQRCGRIINTTSRAGLGAIGMCHHSAAKAGIVALTKSIALEIGKYGITCNAYAPNAATRLFTGEEAEAWRKKRYEAGLYTKEEYEKLLLNPPSPETVTPLIIYLCSDEAANINGQVFRIRGSHIAIYSQPVEKNPIDKEEGLWTVEELIELVPKRVLKGYEN